MKFYNTIIDNRKIFQSQVNSCNFSIGVNNSFVSFEFCQHRGIVFPRRSNTDGYGFDSSLKRSM